MFTEAVRQERSPCTRGQAYALLTARPDNRRPLSWERNQVDVLLFERHTFTCPWTQKRISNPHEYDLDHLLPVSLYPINELWSLLPVDKKFNQHVKRDCVPSPERLTMAQPWISLAYGTYRHSLTLNRALREDATRRFGIIPSGEAFAGALSYCATQFIEEVASARLVARF